MSLVKPGYMCIGNLHEDWRRICFSSRGLATVGHCTVQCRKVCAWCVKNVIWSWSDLVPFTPTCQKAPGSQPPSEAPERGHEMKANSKAEGKGVQTLHAECSFVLCSSFTEKRIHSQLTHTLSLAFLRLGQVYLLHCCLYIALFDSFLFLWVALDKSFNWKKIHKGFTLTHQ